MFGKNEIVGQKYFDKAEDKLFITSMFMTLQGEGPYRGDPAFFVRFAKCNLACSFCDTYFDNGDWYQVYDLIDKIDEEIKKFFNNNVPEWAQYKDSKKRDMVLVITGGEPMLQKNIGGFTLIMSAYFKHVQIESNGTIYQPLDDAVTLVVSPKCLEKDGKAIRYLQPNPNVLERADCLKFVMEADPLSPYSRIPDWALEWKQKTGKQVFISPMNIYNTEPERVKKLFSGQNDQSIEERSKSEVISFWEPGLLDMEQNQKNHEYSAKYCIEHGLTLNLQIHLYASLA